MDSSNGNPYRSPGVEQHASKGGVDQVATGKWQITVTVILTYGLSGSCLILAMFLLVAGINSRSADLIYIDAVVFKGPDEVRRLIYGLFAAAACLLILAGLAFLAAMGLQSRRKWGRQLATGLALLPLLSIGFVPTDYVHLLIPWGAYGMIVLLVLLQQKNRLQFQHGQAYAKEERG